MAALPEDIAHPERLDAIRAAHGDASALAAECSARASLFEMYGQGRDGLRDALARLSALSMLDMPRTHLGFAMQGYAALLPEREALSSLFGLAQDASEWAEPKNGGAGNGDALAIRSLGVLLDYGSREPNEEWSARPEERKRARNAIARVSALDMALLGESGLIAAIRTLCWAYAFGREAPDAERETWGPALMAALDGLKRRIG